MRKPLLRPPPFITFSACPEIDAAAVRIAVLPRDAIRDPPLLRAMPETGMHIRHILPAELIHKTDGIRITPQYPGQLPGGEDGKGIFYAPAAGTGIHQPSPYQGRRSQRTQTRILPLPPPASLILMGNKKTSPHRIMKKKGLTCIAKR